MEIEGAWDEVGFEDGAIESEGASDGVLDGVELGWWDKDGCILSEG